MTDLDVDALVDRYSEELINLTSVLVRIPSENRAPDGDELNAQVFLEEWFKSNGIPVERFNILDVPGLQEHEGYWPGRNYEKRPNVVAHLKGSGGGKSLMLSSHIDTVTRMPLPWAISSPFSGEVKGDRLYGRGSYDMKGSLAASAILLKIIHENSIHLAGDVYVESVVDEENAGANGTLASRLRGYIPDLAIVPEPTNLDICPHSKGGQVFEIDFQGRSGVRYSGEDILNPIYALAKIVTQIEKYEAWINTDVSLPPLFSQTDKPRSVVLSKVKAGDLTPGGNIGIPESAWLEVFIQVLPGYDETRLQQEFYGFLNELIEKDPFLREHRPVIRNSSRFLYPSTTDTAHPIFELLASNYQQVTGQPARIVGASVACDSFIFDHYFGVPTLLFGPAGGNAHGRDEWVSISSLITFVKVALRTVLQFCG